MQTRSLIATTIDVSRRDEGLVEELKEVARRIGLKVREETLLREVGYHVRSGRCRVRGEEVVIIDRNLPASERLDIMLEAVADRDVETHYLTPALRQLLERRNVSAA